MKSTETEKQQYARVKELLDISHQRYLAAGGEPKGTHSGLPGEDFLTATEREELVKLMRLLAGTRVIADEVHCQGRVWKVPVIEAKNENLP